MRKIVDLTQRPATPITRSIAHLIKRAGIIYAKDGLQIKVDLKSRQILVGHNNFPTLIPPHFVVVHFNLKGNITRVEARMPKEVVAILLEGHQKVEIVQDILQSLGAPRVTEATIKRAHSLLRFRIQVGFSFSSLFPRTPATIAMQNELNQLTIVRLSKGLIRRVENMQLPPDKKMVPFPPQDS